MHNLNYNAASGEYAFMDANAKDKAWHGLGQVVEGKAATMEEAIRLSHQDFIVDKKQVKITLTGPDGLPVDIEVPNRFATYRTDTNEPFGVVSGGYHIVQNAEVFEFFDEIVGRDEAFIETAGALGNGSTIFISAKLPAYIKAADELIEQYIMLLSSHDGSGAIKAMFTPVRPVCNNTVTMALSQATNIVTIRHSASAKEKLKGAYKIMGISSKLNTELSTIFGKMARTKISSKDLNLFIEHLFPNEKPKDGEQAKILSTRLANVRADVLEYTYAGPGQDLYTGTLYQAYNGITGYFQNVKEYKSEEAKMNSIILGGAAGTKGAKALNLAISMMN